MFEFLWEDAIAAQGKKPASARKRRRLRAEGVVVQSPLLSLAVALGWLALLAGAGFGSAVERLCALFARAMTSPPSAALIENMLGEAGALIGSVLLVCLAVPATVIAVSAMQTGVLWSMPGSASDSSTSGFDSIGTGLSKLPGRFFFATVVGFLLVGGVGLLGSGFSWQSVSRWQQVSLDRSVGVAVSGAYNVLLVGTVLLTLIGAVDYLLRRRSFEVSIASTGEELAREAWDDDGRPEVRSHRLARARELLGSGSVELACFDASRGLVVLGRPSGAGDPRVVLRASPSDAALVAASLGTRGVPIANSAQVGRLLTSTVVGREIPENARDAVVALYKLHGVGVAR